MEPIKNHYVWTVKVGEKGQIVIPKEARDVFHIKPGDTLLLLGDSEQGLALPSKDKISGIETFLFGGAKK